MYSERWCERDFPGVAYLIPSAVLSARGYLSGTARYGGGILIFASLHLHPITNMSPPMSSGGKRESGTARILGSGASGKSTSELADPRHRRADGLPPYRRSHADPTNPRTPSPSASCRTGAKYPAPTSPPSSSKPTPLRLSTPNSFRSSPVSAMPQDTRSPKGCTSLAGSLTLGI